MTVIDRLYFPLAAGGTKKKVEYVLSHTRGFISKGVIVQHRGQMSAHARKI